MADYIDKELGKCWHLVTLSEKDFDLAYKMHDKKPPYLTSEEMEEVMQIYKKKMEWLTDSWSDLLIETVEEMRKGYKS